MARPLRYQAVSSKLGLRDHPIRRRMKLPRRAVEPAAEFTESPAFG